MNTDYKTLSKSHTALSVIQYHSLILQPLSNTVSDFTAEITLNFQATNTSQKATHTSDSNTNSKQPPNHR